MGKVYIVIHHHDYEGNGDPIKAFWRKDFAQMYAEAANEGRTGHLVFELEVWEPDIPNQIRYLDGSEHG